MQLFKIASSTVFSRYKITTGEDIVAGCLDKKDPAPDIYYIILDGYGRQDVLREVYDFDNGDFILYLTQRGFFVANKSFANYPRTNFSLASTLNLEYLDQIISNVDLGSDNDKPVIEVLRKNTVFNFLKKHGYEIIVVSSGFTKIETRESVYLALNFEANAYRVIAEILGNTPLYLFSHPAYAAEYKLHRKHILQTFEYVSREHNIASAAFVFIHILCPHPPFVFGANGEKRNQDIGFTTSDGPYLVKEGGLTRQAYINQYKDQLTFINRKTKAMIESILSKADRPCVIILQADHGPASDLDWNSPKKMALRERMSILNAYYFSNRAYDGLSDGISPVNSFRLVFNRFFCTNYDILADKAYFSSPARLYKYKDVTQELR